MNHLKKLLAVSLVITLIVSMCSTTAFAATFTISGTPADKTPTTVTINKTVKQAMSWCAAQVGKTLDADGIYPGACVDLAKLYLRYLGISEIEGDAKAYAYASYDSSKLTRLKGVKPQPGDIIIWTGGTGGHVAVCLSETQAYHQSYNGPYVELTSCVTMCKPGGASVREMCWGVLRPNFASDVHIQDETPGTAITDINIYDGDFAQVNGKICYSKDGEIVNGYGVVFDKTSGNWYYVVNGVVDTSFNGLAKTIDDLCKIQKGVADHTSTTLHKDTLNWWSCENGKIKFNDNGSITNTTVVIK